MESLITIAEFNNVAEVKFSLFKDMLGQAGINYIVVNENARIVEPFLISPSNMSIEIKVCESDLARAREIRDSIE
jgi:hypothetical protein